MADSFIAVIFARNHRKLNFCVFGIKTIKSATGSEKLKDFISIPEHITFPTTNGDEAHAFFYKPHSPNFEDDSKEKPPVLVLSHGGPTCMPIKIQILGTKSYLQCSGSIMTTVNVLEQPPRFATECQC